MKVSLILDSAHLEMGMLALNWWVWSTKVGDLAKIANLTLANMDYCMCAYGAKNSDHQIQIGQFAKLNAHQIFPLYDIPDADARVYRGHN